MKYLVLLIGLTTTYSFCQLSPGDILFVGWYGDNGDGLAFVTMNTIPDGTEIYFNDNEWNGQPIGSGGNFNSLTEGCIKWTNNLGGNLPAGVVVVIEGTDTVGNQRSTCGDVSLPSGTGNGCLRINASNEVVYAYQGTNVSTPTTFLAAIANDGFGNGTITNTGLTAGVNAFNFGSIDADADVAVFTGASFTQSAIMNTSNWAVQDGSNDQGQDGIYPEYPDDLPSGTSPCSISTLPVELVDFKVTNVNGLAKLTWQTKSEINNQKFEVYRSANGFDFEQIGQVEGMGNSYFEIDYEYFDQNSLPSISYYRLKQVDFDGLFKWYDIKSFVNEEKELQCSIFPNPTNTNFVFLNSNQLSGILKVEVFDVSGRNLPIHVQFDPDKIQVTGIEKKGVYLFKIYSSQMIISKRIIKL